MCKNYSIFTVLFMVLSANSSVVAQPNTTRHQNLEKSGVAIKGYDPVAYFSLNRAVEGKQNFLAKVDGATYLFSNEQHRELFLENPSKYKPQYGGWCAYAMGANGEKVEIDPETFKLLDGKLYLFFNQYFNNTLKSWNKEEKALKGKADENWRIINKK